ncbi:2Fe-2S iron-sulfur cluster-binding protein [Rufibacter glacialis]|uniref:2Fe-2S iron-sulfur cluster binding domain-containing protein n=1 Tax=Rufibacter glacialis TaxID=1259555 RepID=A0A5M8QPH1_9BACT|nr:2Fe-2S iron-sulfur cluster-binding protein [Rufibacter glacialis]KAA6437141.1 2Fe-2S iron-sulfur cluster binding domain-containing protein [Rufibacter glacialis]GGK61801.1 NADH dehydrogenase subunit G [Rufibacter glacialis]
MVKITFDGIEVEVEEGTTILNAARKIGGEVVPPAMCYYTPLKGTGGKCRACMVRVAAGSAKDPRPMPKLVASCITPVQDGMVVENTTNPDVLAARKGVVEMLLINHPLDCPICDQAGECDLQNFAYEHGTSGTRYEEERRTFDKIDIGPLVQLHMTRCILCYRCVYTADQLTEKRVHGVLGRGDAAEIGTYVEKVIDNEFSGNIIDVCPVGALTDKTFRFKNRVWFTKPVDAHRDCPTCSGKTVLWMRGNDVLRVTARKDEYNEVQEFICNTCRFDKKDPNDWTIEGPRKIARTSVISTNHYELPVLNVNVIPNLPGSTEEDLESTPFNLGRHV